MAYSENDNKRKRHGQLFGNRAFSRDGIGMRWGKVGLGKFWRRRLNKALRAVERMEEKKLELRTPEEVLETHDEDEDPRLENRAAHVASIVDWKYS